MEARPGFAPYLVVSNAAAAIEFYKRAFGAVELERHAAPGGEKLMHAHLLVNGGHLMLSDDFSSQMGGRSETPEALGGSPVTFHLQVDDADATWSPPLSAEKLESALAALSKSESSWANVGLENRHRPISVRHTVVERADIARPP